MNATKNLLEVKNPWPRTNRRKWKANLVQVRLQELALSGEYYDSRVLAEKV